MTDARSFVTRLTTDTSKFNLTGTIKQLDELNKSMVDNQMKQKECNKIINQTKKELDSIQKEIQETGKEDKEQTERIKQLNETLEAEKLKLSQLKSEQAALRQIISETSKEIKGNNQEWTVLKETLAQLAARGIEALGRKLFSLTQDVIHTGEQFTASMSEVGAITGATGEELEKLNQTAREYGATTKFSATETAQALKYMALAGWDANTSMEALPGILDLAAAAGLDLAQASDMVTDYLSAFGMTAKDAAYMADLLTYAQGNSNTSAAQLGQAWGNCAANMHAAGQDVETTTALLEAMANQGLKSAEAGTALAAIMRDITDKMENGQIKIGNTTVTVADAAGNFRDLTDILVDVEKAVGGLGTAETEVALSSTFTSRSLKGMNLVLNEGMENISGYEEALRNSTGAASDAAKTMSDNLSGDLKTLDSALEDLKLSIYEDAEAPLRDIVQKVTKEGIPALKALADNADKLIPVVSSAAGAFVIFKGALSFTDLLNKVVVGFEQLKVAQEAEKTTTEGATAAQAALNGVMEANPVGIVISAVVALTAALGIYAATAVQAKSDTDEFNESLNNLQESADSNIAKIQAETETAKILASQYDELRKKTSLTAEEKERLKTITEELAGYFGTTVEDLKDETGEWRDLTTAIEEHNKKLVEAAELKAYQDMLTEAIKTMNEMQDKMASGIGGKEFNDAKKAYDEASEAAERYRFYLEKIGTVSDESLNKIIDLDRQIKQAENNAQHDRTSGWQDWADGLKKQREELVKQLQNTEKQTTAAGAAFEKATEKEKKDAEGLKQLADELNDTADAEENLQEKLTEANKKVEENQVAITKQRAAMKEAYKAFDNYVTALLRGDEGHTLEEARKLYDAYQSELDKLAQLKTAQTDYKKAVSDLTAEYKKQSETLEDVVKESQKLRSEMSSLSSAYATLEKGQAMDYNTLLDLIDKYPEYADRLLQARDNIDLQKSAVSMLFDAKKQEFILSQQTAIDKIKMSNEETNVFIENTQAQIRALNDSKRVLADMKGIIGENAVSIGLAQADSMAADLQKSIDQIRSYQNRIDWVKSLTVKDFTSPSAASGTSDTSASRSVDAKVQYWRSGYGVKAFGDTELSTALTWLDRVQALDKITTSQVIGHLKQWKADYARTADEIYELDRRIYQAQQKLESEQQAQVQKRLDMVRAAYEKLAEDRIALYKKQSDAAKEAADKEIKALDELKKKRQEDQDDAKRKAELDAVNIQLRYKHLDEISRLELLRKKQDLINEQKEIDFERQLELKKQQLQAGADLTIAQYDRAIGSINELLERLSYFVAQQSGTVTNQQIINNNNSRQNFQIVQGGLSSQQLVAEINRALYSG